MLDIEKQRQKEQLRLDRLRSSAERNRLGQFATPPSLALDVTKYVHKLWGVRAEPVRFLEPALGSGAFYSAFRQVFDANEVAEAVGIEVDPEVAKSASALWHSTGLTTIEADFTKQAPDAPFNLVLTNPPYVRHHHLTKEDKDRLKSIAAQRLNIDVSGLSGLYCHYLLLCDAWLADNGLAAWLIPSEFMDVNYGSAIKKYLTDNVTLIAIHRFCPSDVQFCDALVTSAVVVFRKSLPPKNHQASMSFGGSMLEPQSSELVTLATLQGARKWTQFPTNGTRAIRHADTFGDLFSIKRGLATGSNSFFILDRDEAVRLGIPKQFLKPILPGSRHLRSCIIEGDVLGYPKVEKTLSLIDCDLPEEEIQAMYPSFWEYLESGKRQNVHAGYLASRRTPWYSQERRDPSPFLCTYMGRRVSDGSPFRFYWNKSQATAANVFLMLYPKGVLKKALDSRPDLYPEVLSVLERIKPDSFISEGRVYGGGLYKMEPKELGLLSAEPILKVIGSKPSPRQAEFGLMDAHL